MGSSSSRLGSPPPPPRSPRISRLKRAISSLFACGGGGGGGSTSHLPLQTADDPAELLVISAEHSDHVVNDLHSQPSKDSASTDGKAAAESSSENRLIMFEPSNVENCLFEGKELVAPYQLNADYRYADSASTSYVNQLSLDPVSACERANINALSGFDNMINKDMSQACSDVASPGCSPPDGPGDSVSDGSYVQNHVTGVATIDGSGFSPISDSSLTLQSLAHDIPQEAVPSGLEFDVSDRDQEHRGGNVVHLDMVSISSNILSSAASEITSSREARRNSRRLFWDAFSRHNSRRHSDSRTLLFPTDDLIDHRTRDRWLFDVSGRFFEDGVQGDFGHLNSRTHSMNDRRRRQSRSEIRERLRGGLDRGDARTSVCPSGLHPDGTCSCESNLTAEDSTRASISRIVMLAEALFEVLDEIHQQPVPLAMSMVSLPAPESVVDSFPVKNHKKVDASENGDDLAQCYICLAEYEEGDKIRVLPCHHEYHASCVDKWLKEIHGVCPLCRGDVSEASLSNSENPPL